MLSLYDKTDLAPLKGVVFALNFVMKASVENVIFRSDAWSRGSVTYRRLDVLASIRSVLLALVLPTPTALPSDVDNGPLPESGPHGYSRSTPDPKHRGVDMRHALSPL